MKTLKIMALGLTLGSILIGAQAQGVEYTEGDTDGSKSTAGGTGGSVAADVNMGFNIAKKLALAIHDGSSVSSDPLFNGLDTTLPASVLFFDYNEKADPNVSAFTEQSFLINGLFYTNAEGVTFTVTVPGRFIHEDGSGAGEADVGPCMQRVGVNSLVPCGSNIINSSDYNDNNGAGDFSIKMALLKDSLTNVDRAGIYNATLNITATLP